MVEKIAPLEEEFARLKANLEASQGKLAALTMELEKVRMVTEALWPLTRSSLTTMSLSFAAASSAAQQRARA